jgi:hypothetical protein
MGEWHQQTTSYEGHDIEISEDKMLEANTNFKRSMTFCQAIEVIVAS